MALGPDALVREDILAIGAYHISEAQGMVKLDAMENPYTLPDELRRALAERLARVEINRYPEPTGRRVRDLLARTMQVPEGMALLLGNGSDDLIQIVSLALSRPGAAVMYPEPTFVMYRMNALLTGMRTIAVPLREDFSLDVDAFVARVRAEQPALVFLAYPNNPTGVLYRDEDVRRILDVAQGVVVLDEAYHAFARRTLMPDLPSHPNLVVMRTVSKLGLAGIRLGYLAAHPGWVREFNKVRQAYNVNVLTQETALFVLEHLDVLEAQAGRIREARSALGTALAALPGLELFPSEANFFLVRVADAPATFERLCRQGVLVRNFHGAHPLLAHCLRLTVGTPEENRILIGALREAL